MNPIDPALLEQRFRLRETLYISDRFEKSPNIDRECSVSDHLRICYADCDAPVLPLVCETFFRAYGYVKDWLNYPGDLTLALWMAPELVDLQYMTCLPCGETFFCAPGSRNGAGIILFVSPLSCRRNADKDVLAGLLAHETAHHFIRDISQATVYSMKRKEEKDLPCWLEEGLCQLIQSEVYTPFRYGRAGAPAGTTTRYALDELWNDLSSCEEVDTAYLQAYSATRALVGAKGKADIIRLLHLNRTHDVNWRELSPSKPR